MSIIFSPSEYLRAFLFNRMGSSKSTGSELEFSRRKGPAVASVQKNDYAGDIRLVSKSTNYKSTSMLS